MSKSWPIYKAKGKEVSPYLKLLETIILQRLNPFLEDLNIPNCLQTAYRKGSCSDAIFTTQEALLVHLRKGGHPYLCLFDLEKAFDSIEHSILLKRLFEIGINGRCWRIISDWYSAAMSSVRINSTLSNPFPISRGVKQGSVLSPILFLIAIDSLLSDLKTKDVGLSIYGTFVGAAAHADDVRTIASSKKTIIDQAKIIENFTSN